MIVKVRTPGLEEIRRPLLIQPDEIRRVEMTLLPTPPKESYLTLTWSDGRFSVRVRTLSARTQSRKATLSRLAMRWGLVLSKGFRTTYKTE